MLTKVPSRQNEPATVITMGVSSVATVDVNCNEKSMTHPREAHVVAEAVQDGGWIGWLQVAVAFLAFFNSWGLINSFGVYQTYYSNVLLVDQSKSAISWIGSITSFILSGAPIIAGPLFDLGHPRLLMIGGSFLLVFGMMMTSLCTEYYQFILAQALCTGIGGGFLFINCIAVLPFYFNKRRSLALGLATSGSSISGIICPIIFNQLQPKLGFAWTLRVMGFIALGTLAFSCAFFKTPAAKQSAAKAAKGRFFQGRVLRNRPLWAFNIAMFFGFLGQFIPFFYLQLYAEAQGMSKDLSFYLLTFLCTGSFFGRIVPALLADRLVHPMIVLGTCGCIAGILALCWMAISNPTGLIIFALLYGFFSGAYVSLQPSSISRMSKDMSDIGTRMGVNGIFCALGQLIGNPLAGVIVPRTWKGAQAFCGLALAFSAALCGVARIVLTREENKMLNEETEDNESI